MTATLDDVTSSKRPETTAEEAAARELVRLAREQGLSLTGPDGLLKQLTKAVIETALNEEITEHLGYEKHDPAGQGAGSGNVRSGQHLTCLGTERRLLSTPERRCGSVAAISGAAARRRPSCHWLTPMRLRDLDRRR